MKSLYKLNKILVVTAALLGICFCSMVVIAQPDKGPCPPQEHGRSGPPPAPDFEQWIAQLNFDDATKNNVLVIMQAQHQKRIQAHDQYRTSRDDEHQAMESLHQETLAKLAEVLSVEQVNQFEAMLQQHRPPRPSRRR